MKLSHYYSDSPTTWSSRGDPKLAPDCDWYYSFETPPSQSSTSPSRFRFWPTHHTANVKKFLGDLIRKHRHTLIPYHLPTKTVQELPHPSLTKVLWNHKRKVTDLGRHWRQQECSCKKFAKQHPRAQLHEGHVATGMETLSMPSSLAILSNVGGSNAFFPSKRRLQEQFMDSFQRWTTHHQFPRDQRILDEFQELCQQEWALRTKLLPDIKPMRRYLQ